MTEAVDRLKTALADRYAIERELGSGGMATVYLAHDIRHDRQVAVKVLRPELAAVLGVERFLNEIKVTANLQHPHILPLHDSGDADGFLFYVMPYVEGESLRDKLNREKRLPIAEALDITKIVASALAVAHRQNVIHRDIKPENILLRDGQPILADFGIALAVTAAGGTRLTETGLSLGTPEYMSPEQATADQQLDARSDIYSLACVLYEMLTGEPPITGRSSQAVIAKLLTEQPVRPRTLRDTIPKGVEAAILKALAKTPADRFATVAQFSEALDAASAGDATGAVPQHVSAQRPKRRWSRPALVIAPGLVVVAALVWGVSRMVRPVESGGTEGAEAQTASWSTWEGYEPLEVLQAEPPPGSELSLADLRDGIPVSVVVAHNLMPPAGSLTVSPPRVALLAGSILRGLDDREVTVMTRQLGLSGIMTSRDVEDGRVTLAVAIMNHYSCPGEPGVCTDIAIGTAVPIEYAVRDARTEQRAPTAEVEDSAEAAHQREDSAAGAVSLRILEASPTPGTPLSLSQLDQGVPIRVAVEHNIGVTPPGYQALLLLAARIACRPRPPPAVPDPTINCWRIVGTREASRETMQLALAATLRLNAVFENRITLRVSVLFNDSTTGSGFPSRASTLIEYPIDTLQRLRSTEESKKKVEN